MKHCPGLYAGSKKNWRGKGAPLAAVMLVLLFLVSACAPSGLDTRLREITGPFRFSLAAWEINALLGEMGKLLADRPETGPGDYADVAAYFEGTERDAGQTGQVEAIIEAQVREAYRAAGIMNPFDDYLKGDAGFPPVNIHLGDPPRLLVVSPRDRIARYREVLLLPDIALPDIEAIEAAVEELGYSALVVGLGGLSTFPSYIANDAGVRFILNAVAEEWLHQYLAFTPLGFRYLLDVTGIRPDSGIATMNETVAGIVSEEIGGRIYERYYAGPADTAEDGEPVFDFNAEMREIRRAVDGMLGRGEIAAAEAFMREKRDFLEENGYRIRKLNQAYFAFHGTYAASPTSIDPIGAELKELRSRSDSLEDFLDTVSRLTSRQELAESLP